MNRYQTLATIAKRSRNRRAAFPPDVRPYVEILIGPPVIEVELVPVSPAEAGPVVEVALVPKPSMQISLAPDVQSVRDGDR